MKKILIPVFLLSVIHTYAQENVLQYVKPITGTQRMGHTYPGATVPFGAVQLSPETDTIPYEMNGKYNPDVYKYCAGYQYEDKTIVGFSHTHFSGTGHSDLGDILIMPAVGKLQLNPGTADHPESGYRSPFSHSNEVSAPGYYKVKLDRPDVTAEMTATNRVGFHKYTFNAGGPAHIILDMMYNIYNYENKNVWTYIRVENDSLITGFRQTNGWARTRTVYFAIAFSKPFKSYGQRNYASDVYRGFWRKFDQTHNFPEMAGKQIRAYFDFDAKPGDNVELKVALSPVSTAGALKNLQEEAPGWDFAAVKQSAEALWTKELNKIHIESSSKEEKENFYTAMYHAFINPTTYMDVDGNYRGLDMNVHNTNGYTNYTTFSLWDTYRALHPFFNVIQPTRNADMVRSMLSHYEQSAQHMLPVWAHYANENWCMIGYHSVSVIADAIMKGNAPFDANKALDACVTTARHRSYDGLGYYIDKGYIPEDKEGSSVSKVLEYAYDDWCIAQVAKKLGRQDIYDEFIQRSQNYKNVYDRSTGFMRPRLSDGSFKKDFDPLQTHDQGFIEGNAWNYSLYVPQYPADMITMMGGKKAFARHLDSLFTMELPDKYFAETEDITRDGIIGNYVHGNEPSHHVVYLYNHTDQPWKTQDRVRMILKKMYHPGPDGLGGNDDCGQMSAWYIFSSLGFYPMCPGSDQYELGSPAVDKATLQLENGKTFVVEAKNQNDKNVYVQQVLLNGKPWKQLTISHADIMNGGTLTFVMGNKPKDYTK
ncbi:GH92 family glycosyl hydrolase [Chitinophaga sp. Cy-1792]|uniref:GH92 family glycosyl hydrolase n=1 Tax=Chitinophaga sp. Cy-1792 TaxID=2608339 RepID=UPI001420807D|nr:GH92 family glycosyl hydrolase [Chitinophaga sp. Cy-1792]NIG52942.1 glycoside hydrolase family 92 protein [Chitinophaga sp. Cy-1792]